MYIAQTQQKEVNRMASLISPPRRERARFISISSPSATVQHPVTACPYVARTGPSHYAHTSSSSQRSSQTQLGLAVACLETQCRNMLPSRCLVPRSLGFSEIFFRLSRISFTVMCFWSHSVRVSKCPILPTPLLAPIPLAAEASPAPGLDTSS